WCDRRDGCGPGAAWLQRPDRRAMGMPVVPVVPVCQLLAPSDGRSGQSRGVSRGGADGLL
ncbi:MAG: hypothetical protein ACLGI3_12115, partial [Actinomycetes bacterium]